MSTAIRPLPQQEGSPHHGIQPHTTNSQQLELGGGSEGSMEAKGAPPAKRHHDFTVPIKPPSESNKNVFSSSSSIGKCHGTTIIASRSARSGSTTSTRSNPTNGKGQQQKPIGVLKAERRYSRSPDTIGATVAAVRAVAEGTSYSVASSEFAVASSAVGSSARTSRSATSGITTISGDDTETGDTSGSDAFENGRNAGGRGGMSGNLLEPGGTHQITSVDDLERRFAVLAGDGGDSCARTDIDFRGVRSCGSDQSGGDGRYNRTPDNTTFGTTTASAPKKTTQTSPKITMLPLKMTRQEQVKQIQVQRELLKERSSHPNKIRNPFGRPLPREHAHSSRHLQKSMVGQEGEPGHVMVLKPISGTSGAAISAQERAERFTAITASTAPTTTISSEGGWLDRHLRALGGKKPAGRDVRVFEIEEGRELTSDEIKSLQSKASAATKSKESTRTKGISSAAAAVLQEEHDIHGAERWFSAPSVPDDVTADVQTHGGETVDTMGEETAGAAMLGLTHQLQSVAFATAPPSMVKQKPWKKQNQQQKQKRRPTFNDEVENARERRERRLEKAANRELDKEAAKTFRKKGEGQLKQQEQADASRLRKRSRVAEAGAEGRGIASVYTSGESASGDTKPTVPNVLSSYQLLRSRQASRPMIGNLEILDKDAIALERDIWQGIDEMMRDAMTMAPEDDGGTVYSADVQQVPNSEESKRDASSSYYSRYSTRSQGTAGSTHTTRSRAWDMVSRLGDTMVSRADKSDTASPSSDDIGEILLAKSALQGFISFFGEQDASEKPSSEEPYDSMGDLTDYTREEVVAATRELPGHSVRSTLKHDSKELKSRQAKQKLVLEGLLELSSRSLGETKREEEKESDDAEHSLGSMDDYMLGQVALDAFADVLIGQAKEDTPMPSDNLTIGTSSTQLDLTHDKKALLRDEQLTLFEVFRWSLAVNIDANIRKMGKEERRVLKLNDRSSKKQKIGNRRSRTSKRGHLHVRELNPSPSKLDEQELKRQIALTIDDVGTAVETTEELPLSRSFDGVSSSSSSRCCSDDEISSPEDGVMNYRDFGDNNGDGAVQKRRDLWKTGLRLDNKRSERALNLLSAASRLGLKTSSAKRGENEVCTIGGENHYDMSGSSAQSRATGIIGNARVGEKIVSTTLSLVPEESEKSSPHTSQTSSTFDAEKGMHGLYANIERWENDEDGDSSAQEDAASAAFALISSAPGAKMPTARPAIPRTSQSPQRSDLSGTTPQSDVATNSTSTFGLSRSGSGRSKASGLSLALESIPEQDVGSTIALSTRSFGSAVTVPDDDSSAKIYEDLKRIRDKYGLDEDEITSASRKSTGNGTCDVTKIQDNPLRSSSDSAADIINSLRDISARYGLDLLEDGKSLSRNGALNEKRKKNLSSSDDERYMGESSSTDEKRSTATSQMKKSNSQSTKATNQTQQSVRFAEDYDTPGKDMEEHKVDCHADSEDSFLKWKVSVKSMYSEISKTSHSEEKYSTNEGAASTLLGAFREDSGLTEGISEGTSKASDNDPVLNAFMESTNYGASRHSLSSASSGLSQSTAGGSMMRTANTNKLMNALTQEQRESGTTRSSSRPNSSSIFYSSSTTRGSSSNTASIFHSSPATQRNELQPGWDSCPPRPSLKRSASADRISSGTLTNTHSSAAVASGFASSTSKTTGTHSGSTSNNYQSSVGAVSGPHSSDAVGSSEIGKTGDKGSNSNDTSSGSIIGNPESFFSADDGNRTNNARKEAYPPTCNHPFDPISITSTLFDPLASSKERLDTCMRAKSRSRSASTGASSQSDRVPVGNDMTPLNHEARMASPQKMPRRYSDSSVVSVGAISGIEGGNGMDSLFASVKKSFARGKGTAGK